MLADNKLAELAGWDPQILSIELQGLLDIGYDLDLTGFAPAEIDLLFEAVADTNDSTSPDDAVPDRIETNVVSRPGDMWLLGDHRVQCADARDQAAYRRLLGNKKADLVFADAPYNVHITGHVGGLGTIKHREFAMASGEMSDAAYAAFLSKTFGNAVQASRDGAVQFWCMDWRHTMPLQLAAREANAKHLNVCIWVKNNGGMGSLYRSQHELVFVFKVGTAPHINNVELGKHGRNRTNVWNYPGVNTFRAGRLEELAMHPTVKPVALVADAIKDVSKRGNLVLDPFAGSGTTVISAEKTGRRAFCIEIDPVYVDVAVRRWQEFTGRRAVLAGTQASFDERAGEIVQLKRDKTDGKAKP
jgi:DNA modification methylase